MINPNNITINDSSFNDNKTLTPDIGTGVKVIDTNSEIRGTEVNEITQEEIDNSFFKKPLHDWDLSQLGLKLKPGCDLPKFDPSSVIFISNFPIKASSSSRVITPQYSHMVYDENGKAVQISKTGQFVQHTFEGEKIVVYGNKPLMGECGDIEEPYGLQIKTNTLFNNAQYAGKSIGDVRDYFFDCVKNGDYKKAKKFLDPIASKYKNTLESLIHDALAKSPWGSVINNLTNTVNNGITNWVNGWF